MDKSINKRLSSLGVADNDDKIVLVDEYIYLYFGDIFRDDDEFFDVHEKQWIKFKDSDDDISKFIGLEYEKSWVDENTSKDFKGFRRKVKIKVSLDKKIEIKCEVLSGAWKGETGTIIGTIPGNGAFIVELKSLNMAFFGNEIKGV